MTLAYIHESMNPYVILVLFVHSKDETWMICVDRCAINKITLKYRHPIHRLDNMLDELHGFCIFFKINLKSGYYQIMMKEGDLHLKLNIVCMND